MYDDTFRSIQIFSCECCWKGLLGFKVLSVKENNTYEDGLL